MKKLILILAPVLFLFACKKTEMVDDSIPEKVRINASIDSLGVDSTFTFAAIFFNNIGTPVADKEIFWTVDDTSLLSIDSTSGVAIGKAQGTATVQANAFDTNQNVIFDSKSVYVGQQGSMTREEKNGTIVTTSSYELRGTYSFIQDADNFFIQVNNDYFATSALPGLYIYLSNNLNSLNGAYEIGAVTVFQGEHTYDLGTEININDYQYILYYCKPFNVEVGEGRPNN